MRLCVSAALVLLSALTTADLSPGAEECRKLNFLQDKTRVLGRFYFLATYTDHSFFKTIFGFSSSSWANVTATQTGYSLTQFNKINGTCIESRANVTVSGDTAKIQMNDMTSEFELLVFSDTSLIMDLRFSTSNVTSTAQKLKLNQLQNQDQGDVSLRAQNYHLISKDSEVSETDLQKFIAHAKCAGFTGDPDFIHKSDQGYCSEEESVLIH